MLAAGKIGVPSKGWASSAVAYGYNSSNPTNPADNLGRPSLVSTVATAEPPGQTRFVGSAPTALPTTLANLYIRKTGSDNNGGSSNTTGPDRTGTDGVTDGSTTFVAATGSFTANDVNKLINILTKGRYRITAFTNSTTVTLSGSPSAGSSLTWNLGGACLTIGALLANANAAVLGGDRIWIGAGTYREIVTVSVTPTFELRIEADVDGAMTGDPGMVQWTAYTTDDKTAPSASNLLNLNGKSNLTFRGILFVTGSSAFGIVATALTSQYVSWLDCTIIGGHNAAHGLINATAGYLAPLHWLFDRCRFLSGVSGNGFLQFGATNSVQTADYDIDIILRNCSLIAASSTILIINSGGNTGGKGNGVHLRNCTLFGGLITSGATTLSSMFPCTVLNCLIFSGGPVTAVSGAASGHTWEDYNLIIGSSARANTPIGPHSVSDGSYAPLFHIGQELQWGASLRPYAEPMNSSPLLGFASPDRASDLRVGTRPAGGLNARPSAGSLDRGNTYGKETGTVHTGSNAISITGPGYQDFSIPVSTSAAVLSMYLRRNGTYTGPMPQLIVLNGSEAGVPVVGASMQGPANAWEQVTLPSFTAVSNGIVTLRVVSYDTNGAGVVYGDTFAQA